MAEIGRFAGGGFTGSTPWQQWPGDIADDIARTIYFAAADPEPPEPEPEAGFFFRIIWGRRRRR
jgi:hypothetical protein